MNHENIPHTSDSPAQNSARKPYESPQLVIYGNISEITQAVDNMGMAADGGSGMMDKT